MTFKIFLLNGGIVEVDMSAIKDFNFLGTCIQTRVDGCFKANNLFVPYDKILFMATGDASTYTVNAPSTETKQ